MIDLTFHFEDPRLPDGRHPLAWGGMSSSCNIQINQNKNIKSKIYETVR